MFVYLDYELQCNCRKGSCKLSVVLKKESAAYTRIRIEIKDTTSYLWGYDNYLTTKLKQQRVTTATDSTNAALHNSDLKNEHTLPTFESISEILKPVIEQTN